MANIITSLRILFSIVLLFIPVLSSQFYIIYLLCGFTDIIDGALARKTDSDTKFGAKFDSIADFLFVIICLIKLFPVITFPFWIWMWIITIGIFKISNYTFVYIKYRKFPTFHTTINKITGLSLFVFTLAIKLFSASIAAIPVCILASMAAIQEGYYIFKYRTFEIS